MMKIITYFTVLSCNLFRPLPPSLCKDFDPDEDEPTHDLFVYESELKFDKKQFIKI